MTYFFGNRIFESKYSFDDGNFLPQLPDCCDKIQHFLRKI